VTGRQNERERVHSVGTCSSEQRWLTARSTRSHQAGASVQRKTAALPAQRAALQEEETAALPMREERHRKGRNRQRHSDPQEERHRTLERMHGRQPRVGGTVADGIRKEEGTDSNAPTRGRKEQRRTSERMHGRQPRVRGTVADDITGSGRPRLARLPYRLLPARKYCKGGQQSWARLAGRPRQPHRTAFAVLGRAKEGIVRAKNSQNSLSQPDNYKALWFSAPKGVGRRTNRPYSEVHVRDSSLSLVSVMIRCTSGRTRCTRSGVRTRAGLNPPTSGLLTLLSPVQLSQAPPAARRHLPVNGQRSRPQRHSVRSTDTTVLAPVQLGQAPPAARRHTFPSTVSGAAPSGTPRRHSD
jgi:hypothetical protein